MTKLMLMTLVLCTACATDRLGAPRQTTKVTIGTFVSGEYAYFERSDGRVFDLRLPNKKDQRKLADIMLPMPYEDTICLAMRIRGKPDGNVDGTGRPLFIASEIAVVQQIDCSKRN